MNPPLVDKKLRMLYNHLDQKFNISDERRNSLLQLRRYRSQYGAYRDLAETTESRPLCITDLFQNKSVAYF